MSENDAEATVVHSMPTPTSGRLAVLTGLSVAASAIPIPFLPDRVVEQIRGAIAQDVAGRHGLSLTTDARAALAHTSSESTIRNAVRKGIGVLSKTVLKRLGPLAALSTAARSVEVYALGVLFDHYVSVHRPKGDRPHRRGRSARDPRSHRSLRLARAVAVAPPGADAAPAADRRLARRVHALARHRAPLRRELALVYRAKAPLGVRRALARTWPRRRRPLIKPIDDRRARRDARPDERLHG